MVVVDLETGNSVGRDEGGAVEVGEDEDDRKT